MDENFEQVVKILNNHSAAVEILIKKSIENTPKLEALDYNLMHFNKIFEKLEKRFSDFEKRSGDFEKRFGDFEKRIKSLELGAHQNEAASNDRVREENSAVRREAELEMRLHQMDTRIKSLEVGQEQVAGKKQTVDFPEEKVAQSISRFIPPSIVSAQKKETSHVSAPVFKSPIVVPAQKQEGANPTGPVRKCSVPAEIPPVTAQDIAKDSVLPSTLDHFIKKDQQGEGGVHQTLGGFGKTRAYRSVNPTNVANVARPRAEVPQPGLPVDAFSTNEENTRNMRRGGLGFGRNFGRYHRG